LNLLSVNAVAARELQREIDLLGPCRRSAVIGASLTTEALELRPCAAEDLDVLFCLWTDPAVRRFLFDDRELSCEEALRLVDRSETCFREDGYGLWLFFEKGEPSLAGLLRAPSLARRRGEPDLRDEARSPGTRLRVSGGLGRRRLRLRDSGSPAGARGRGRAQHRVDPASSKSSACGERGEGS
jgi:hypothetical protein